MGRWVPRDRKCACPSWNTMYVHFAPRLSSSASAARQRECDVRGPTVHSSGARWFSQPHTIRTPRRHATSRDARRFASPAAQPAQSVGTGLAERLQTLGANPQLVLEHPELQSINSELVRQLGGSFPFGIWALQAPEALVRDSARPPGSVPALGTACLPGLLTNPALSSTTRAAWATCMTCSPAFESNPRPNALEGPFPISPETHLADP
jgi:hypothetical protein